MKKNSAFFCFSLVSFMGLVYKQFLKHMPCQFEVFCSSIINNIGFTFVVGYLEDIQQMLTSLR